MKKPKTYFIAVSFIGIALAGIGTIASAGEKFFNPEISILQKEKEKGNRYIQEKIAALPALIEEERRMRPIQNMPREEREMIIQNKQRGHEEQLRELSRNAALLLPEEKMEQPSFRGILEGSAVPAPFTSSEFKVVNFWGGEVNEKRIGVYAGYLPTDPSRGVMVVFDDESDTIGDFYYAPNSSGPLRIVSEQNGVLILASVRGNFEVYGTPGKRVHSPGSSTYRFDINSRLFQ